MIREAEFAQSTPDFINKMSIALKEANECDYWLSIIHDTDYLEETLFISPQKDCRELVAVRAATVKTTKK